MEQQLRQTLTQAISKGESINTTARNFSNVTGGSFKDARRIIRTETIATYTKASLDSYSELGIEKIRVISETDACPVCTKAAKIIEIEKVAQGENIPPFHPNCRCAIAPIVESEG
jgi:SPP1 gp7 family putative phage head morphogenesis protein